MTSTTSPHFGKALHTDGQPLILLVPTTVHNVGGTPESFPTSGDRVTVEDLKVGDWAFMGGAFRRVTTAPRPFRGKTRVVFAEKNGSNTEMVVNFTAGTERFMLTADEANELAR